MKILCLLLITISLGCTTMQVESTTKTTTCKASGTSFFMSSEQLQASACHGSVDRLNSKVDAGAIVDILNAAKGVK